jgi:hypothetical protein
VERHKADMRVGAGHFKGFLMQQFPMKARYQLHREMD